MKIQLLIAVDDRDYTDFLSAVLAEKYAETFEVTACSSPERLRSLGRRCDIALLDPAFAEAPFPGKLALLLWDGMTPISPELEGLTRLRKYQRISSLASELLSRYAAVSDRGEHLDGRKAKITLVWSPIGGSGKTTVALAYAAQRVTEGKQAVYLDLQTFSGSDAYFPQTGKGLSSVLDQLDGNLPLLLQSILKKDSGSGIGYFCQPENYDDIAILSGQDIRELVEGCSTGADEVVVDLSSAWDERTKVLLEIADRVLLVVNSAGYAKWLQFRNQNGVFDTIREKTVLVGNQGFSLPAGEALGTVTLPAIQMGNRVSVYKNLSVGYFPK